jgi:hypothetical protein
MANLLPLWIVWAILRDPQTDLAAIMDLAKQLGYKLSEADLERFKQGIDEFKARCEELRAARMSHDMARLEKALDIFFEGIEE